MMEILFAAIQSFPPQVSTFFLAMLPLTELRAALPIALSVFDLSVAQAVIFSYLGNLVPMVGVLLLLPILVRWTEKRIPWVHRIMEKYFHALERKHRKKYDRYGQIALFILVALPLPGSGVWTASVLAVLFDIDWRYSAPAIILGLMATTLIVLMATVGSLEVISLWR